MVNIRGWAGELRYSLQSLDELKSESWPSLDEEGRRRVATALEADIPEALDRIEQSIARADHLLGRLLELSRVARRELVLSEVDLRTILESALRDLEGPIAAKGCSVELGILPLLRVDPLVIEQILARLLSNAVTYLLGDRPGRIAVSSGEAGGRPWIAVADNGRGIDPADSKRIFAPFRSMGKADTAGEGMGLTMAQALARRHGGHIVCESTPGEGSRFTLWLPAAAAVQEPRVSASERLVEGPAAQR